MDVNDGTNIEIKIKEEPIDDEDELYFDPTPFLNSEIKDENLKDSDAVVKIEFEEEKEVQKSNIISSESTNQQAVQNNTNRKGKSYKCDVCGQCFLRKIHFQQHVVTHTGYKPFKCDTCGKGFNRPRNLLRHHGIHTGYKPYKCELCHMSFSQSAHLKSHLISHSPIKPFECQECGKRFAQKFDLKRHDRNNHKGIKPFECKECGKCFAFKVDLNKHMTIHAEIKPHVCDVCGKRFPRKCHLNQHLRTGHAKKNKFNCGLCDMS